MRTVLLCLTDGRGPCVGPAGPAGSPPNWYVNRPFNPFIVLSVRVCIIFGKRRRCRVEQEGDPGDARRDLLEQPQPLAGQGRLHIDETGDVVARRRVN
jgi:hypothetical protein